MILYKNYSEFDKMQYPKAGRDPKFQDGFERALFAFEQNGPALPPLFKLPNNSTNRIFSYSARRLVLHQPIE